MTREAPTGQGARKRILAVVGTRPEAIKMAPVIRALRSGSWAEVRVLATAQHRQMLDQVLEAFAIVPDVDLDIMAPNQTLPELTSRLLSRLDEVFARERPDAVLIQGDTTTVMTAAMAAFYRHIAVGHVEAGLRTGDLHNPFPEEMNRIVAGRLSRWHFAPTIGARDNLLREGFDPSSVHVTGNTVIDALLDVVQREVPLPVEVPEGRRMLLVTAHRRENFGAPFREICGAVRDIADRHADVHVVYPVHPNPNVSGPAHEILSGHARIVLCPPLDYLPSSPR
jgi:UDP-N-acetylglucosamine 2-epimerase (non-hydrolysing)